MVLEPWPDQRARAVDLAKQTGAVRIESNGERADVASFSKPNLTHTVTHAGTTWICDCDFYIATGLQCGHAIAVRYLLTTRTIPVKAGSPQATYDRALMDEERLFGLILGDLCASIPEPDYKGTGRPPLPLAEQAFCAVQKVASMRSCRRAKGIHDKAAQAGIITHSPGFVTASRFLNRDDAEGILRELIQASASPLAGLESAFAADSTGFRTTTFTPYCQDKHGQKRRHEYVKAHAMTGVKTNVVTDVLVLDGNSPDVVQLPALVEGTMQHFDMEEISADKAYSARYNLNAINNAGATPFIPFKKNASGKRMGSFAWVKAFHYFQAHREDFDAAYHKRSNVEATFSAIKRRFGDSVKSRKAQAQRNEVLAKILAYNIMVLIKAAHQHRVPLTNLFQNPDQEEV